MVLNYRRFGTKNYEIFLAGIVKKHGRLNTAQHLIIIQTLLE